MALLDKFFRLHLLLVLASAQWWGLQRGFRSRAPTVDISPLGRFGAQRGIGVAKQPAAGYFRASSSNFFRVSQLFDSCPCNNFTCLYWYVNKTIKKGSSNYGSSRFGPRPASVSSESSDGNRLTRWQYSIQILLWLWQRHCRRHTQTFKIKAFLWWTGREGEVNIFIFRNLSSSKSEQQLASPPSKSSPSNDVVATRTSKKASNQPLSVEQKKEVDKENVTRGWLVPPSLEALPAVPGSLPLKQPLNKTPYQMTSDGSQTDEGNLYEKFMPVPAVPNSAANLQASRKPKDSLASVDLNVSQLNIAPAAKASTHAPRSTSPPATQPTRTTSPPAIRPTSPPRPAPAVPQQSLSSEEEKQEIRKKFKRCHGRCVQKQCLPVGNLDVYYRCGEKCKQLCTLWVKDFLKI